MDTLHTNEVANFLEHALRITAMARGGILTHFNARPQTEWKSDLSPVTIADREAELCFRNELLRVFPSHGFCGEEFGITNPESPYRWIVDPIDGTQSFIHGVPTFGIMVALEYKGEAIIGIVDHPALNLCYSAGKGLGTRCNDTQIRIRDIPLDANEWLDAREILCLCTRATFALNGSEALWDTLVQRNRFFRIYYDCFGLSQCISGSAAALIEMNVPTWDLAPVPVLVREAGGACYELPRWKDSEGLERRSMVIGKPSHAGRLYKFMQEGS